VRVATVQVGRRACRREAEGRGVRKTGDDEKNNIRGEVTRKWEQGKWKKHQGSYGDYLHGLKL